MQLSDAAGLSLQAWVGKSTWHTSHVEDMGRWYDFVDRYERDHGHRIDEVALREHIEHEVEEDANEDLRAIIRSRISLACNILEFLHRSRR